MEDTKKYETPRKSKDIVGAVFLVFIGIIFLLNTTGVLDWGVWIYLLRFWPIFLILGGIKLIIGKSFVAEIILSVVSLVLFVLIGLFSYIAYTAKTVSFLPKQVNECITEGCNYFWRVDGAEVNDTLTVKEEEYTNIEKRVLDFKIGAAKFEIKDSDSTDYISADVKYYGNYGVPQFTSKSTNNTLNIKFNTITTGHFIIWPNKPQEYNFNVGQPEIATDILVDLGAGDGVIELEKVDVNKIDANIGAGKLTLNINENTIPKDKLIADVGAGELVINIPKDVAYEISYDLGVGEIDIDNEKISGISGKNSSYKSSNYDDAEKRILIDANVGVGKLEINTVENI